MPKRDFIGRLGSLIAVLALAGACGVGEIGDVDAAARLTPNDGNANRTSQPVEPSNAASSVCSGASPDLSASDGWLSSKASLPAFGTLYFETEARPTAPNLDGLMAVGAEDINDFAEAAITVRFADDGFVDVRDGDLYTSDVFYAYQPGVWYKIAISADIASETYDVEIGRCGEPRETLIEGASFRNGANVSDQLSTWAVWSSQTAALELSTPTWMASGGCAPATCQSLGLECGQPSNGCGGSLNCGGCGSGESCSSGLCVSNPSAPPPIEPPPAGGGDPSDKPGAHNTGPSNPAALVASGPITITTDGAVYENLDVTGDIWVDADNVTIRNFRIDANGEYYGINVRDGHRGILVEDGEIYGMSSAGILGLGYTGRRLHIHDSYGDALKAQGTGSGPTVIEYSFIEKNGRSEGAHADGNQTTDGSNITFRYNNIDMPDLGSPGSPGTPYKSNATFMISGAVSNFLIEGNWLNGGSYTVYCYDNNAQVIVRNNYFGRDALYGLNAPQRPCKEWSGNVWEDTGDPL